MKEIDISKSRGLTINDRDDEYLHRLGSGNVTTGARIAVTLIRMIESTRTMFDQDLDNALLLNLRQGLDRSDLKIRVNVRLTDSDRDYIKHLGAGNVSLGIRVAIMMIRTLDEEYNFLPKD